MVHGISFRIRKQTRNLSRLFPAERGEEQFHIGTLHCNVGGQDRATDKHAITKCCRDRWAAYPNARGLTVNPEQIFPQQSSQKSAAVLSKKLRPHASLRQRRFNLKKANSAL
jgi:hypothetical protein